jgi:hypothetical protein
VVFSLRYGLYFYILVIFGAKSPGPYLTSQRDKIPPVVIHYNFEGDTTRLKKDFHTKFEPLGFTTYRIKSGIACQTSTLNDYLNLQKFLKDNKVPFNLLKSVNSKPYKVVIKGITPTTPPNVIQDKASSSKGRETTKYLCYI